MLFSSLQLQASLAADVAEIAASMSEVQAEISSMKAGMEAQLQKVQKEMEAHSKSTEYKVLVKPTSTQQPWTSGEASLLSTVVDICPQV